MSPLVEFSDFISKNTWNASINKNTAKNESTQFKWLAFIQKSILMTNGMQTLYSWPYVAAMDNFYVLMHDNGLI